MATKKTARPKVERVSDQVIDQGIALLKDPSLSASKKRKLREAAFAGIQTGEVSFSQLCRISRT